MTRKTTPRREFIRALPLTVAFSLGVTLPGALGDDVPTAKTPTATGVVGDGVHDDTAGIQALLDTRRSRVYLPSPPKHYLISKPLQIHSHQTLQLDRFTVIRLQDGSDCLMITNDDLVALNADDGGIYEMSRCPIADIVVDGLWARDGYTAVRLLSAGAPIRRVHLANILGAYRFNAVSFTTHRVHPGSASTFEDISLRGLFCAKSGTGVNYDSAQPGWSGHSLIVVEESRKP